ncbi:cytochrome c biogenesis CcdA family protein [Arthrobacter sp. 2RAF22]|uniref:cytochrome c biogenesis CcdA family protein n=1 Tax=Arthrobacter sp. 2RAF22 TaxID=3232996 RepID=UPI003F92C191
MTSPDSGAGAVFYAFTLGLVAAVNPCGFPMLPAYLVLFSANRPGDRGSGGARALLTGASVSAGFVAVFGVLGLLFETGARLATGWLPPIMAAVGLLMAVAGVSTLFGHPPALRLPAPRMRAGRSVLAMALYGVAYATGSLSCSLPLFLAAVAGSFTGQGVLGGLRSYLAYALGMALFVTAAAVATTALGAAAVRRIGAAGRWLGLISGITLTLSGAYLAYYWLAELVDPAAASTVTASVQGASGWIASLIGAAPALSSLVLGVLVLVPIALIIRRILTEPQHQTEPQPPSAPPTTASEQERGNTGP